MHDMYILWFGIFVIIILFVTTFFPYYTNYKKNKQYDEENKVIYSQADMDAYTGKEITLEDVDHITEILMNFDSYYKEYLNEVERWEGRRKYYNKENSHIRQTAFKQAILDYAYLNYKKCLKQDQFGERHCDIASNACCREYGTDPYSIAAGYFNFKTIRPYFMGWTIGEKYKLTTPNEHKLSYKIK